MSLKGPKAARVTDEERIRQLVRRVVYRTVGRVGDEGAVGSRSLMTAEDVQRIPSGAECTVAEGTLVTPLARQAAMERKVRLVESSHHEQDGEASGPYQSDARKTVAVGADHGGYLLKNRLADHMREMGYTVVDCGTGSADSVDYPDLALAVARLVASGDAWRGVVVDGAGIGSCMAANKVPGVRAALCYDEATAVNSREHNHANVLTLGAGLIGESLARQIVTPWLATSSGGGRHQRRVDKIGDIERRFARAGGGPRR
jgi:ribose 5-phosphate isomerase B